MKIQSRPFLYSVFPVPSVVKFSIPMPRSALIFVVAIFLPSLVLGWLALRTAGEQRVLIERQEVELRQAETDSMAAQIRELMDQKQLLFSEMVRRLVGEKGTAALAENFETRLRDLWTDGGTPFAINPSGALAFPTLSQSRGDESLQNLVTKSADFLSNRRPEEVFQSQLASGMPKGKTAPNPPAPTANAKESPFSSSIYPSRNVAPQKNAESADRARVSKIAPAVADFQTATEGATQGILARFVQNEVEVIFWTRPDPGTNWIFGVTLNPGQIEPLLRSVLAPDDTRSAQFAILNERARPVVREPGDFTADWKRPFVATEIGEALPQWEVALYLTHPGKLTDSARLVTMTLVLLIALALAAILAGGFFVARDTQRQLALAQKKTDFVSNVSHELKTPLTSIRLFAEMLVEGRVTDPEKRQRYLRIISSESERLTRLVNNVLDFARNEKNRKTYQRQSVDLRPLIASLWESEAERLQEKGFFAEWRASSGDYVVDCDPDAIAQVMVNLLSNAEKYSQSDKSVELDTRLHEGRLQICVKDRGIGIPRELTEKIFDPFFRADDSLASGVPGSGLGLTLARRIARDHGGDLVTTSRNGGGSVFIFTLPLR